ncbi:hypothetical protein RBH29_17050 [Herbivorax sp. ANBcel31]|uniref:hypothetical protein n=1 Tax=Herbivorax sp. ANBcel31 TaxID=3069754 RepID=UPI0027AF000D|nr:hypothetical protein [Herbivorax sp. ANBcel31]MDQ2088135.1 hypothetical protein [Herbivorax sp. ANBcel31]
MNKKIRNKLSSDLNPKGTKIQSRFLISKLAKQFKTTKQRISGNISFMVRNGDLIVHRKYPKSELELS